MKYWEILLSKQQERGKDGLTLPFLIGSQNYLPVTYTHQCIGELIRDMVSSDAFETCIRYCMGTATLVFEIRKKRNFVYYPTHNFNAQNNLSIGFHLKNELGEDTGELIENLIDKFQSVIDKELFSAESNMYERAATWVCLSNEDVEFIESSFMSL